MSKLSVDHLLSIKNLKKTDIELIFKTMITLKKLLINLSKRFLLLGILQSQIYSLKILQEQDCLLSQLKKDYRQML